MDRTCCFTALELKRVVALSSAEAELHAALEMGCEILGISQFCREPGDDMEVKINGDSSAVKGILARRGCGKVKHLEVKQLWLQEQVRSGKVDFQKDNPSGALTAPLHRRGCEEALQAHGLQETWPREGA